MTDAAVLAYLRATSVVETDIQRHNRLTTEASGCGHIQLAPEQGQLLALIAKLVGARRALEIGVYAGYSALWLAGALPPGGQLVACDNDGDITQRARSDWARAGLADCIELRLGPALDTLDREISAGMAGRYDLALIDADKQGYIDYYERCMTLVRPGGVILADNTLWYGRVATADRSDETTAAILAFNDHLARDARVDISMIPIGDGLTVARKR